MMYVVHTASGAMYSFESAYLTWSRVNPGFPVVNLEETSGLLRVMPKVELGRPMVIELDDGVCVNTTRVVHAEMWAEDEDE